MIREPQDGCCYCYKPMHLKGRGRFFGVFAFFLIDLIKIQHLKFESEATTVKTKTGKSLLLKIHSKLV